MKASEFVSKAFHGTVCAHLNSSGLPGPEFIAAVCANIGKTEVTQIELENNKLTAENILPLCELIAKNGQIKTLYLRKLQASTS